MKLASRCFDDTDWVQVASRNWTRNYDDDASYYEETVEEKKGSLSA
jgi:hypothetical protein